MGSAGHLPPSTWHSTDRVIAWPLYGERAFEPKKVLTRVSSQRAAARTAFTALLQRPMNVTAYIPNAGLMRFEVSGNQLASGKDPSSWAALLCCLTDQRVLEHLCGLLFGLLLAPDASIAQLSLEVLMALLELIQSQDISRKLLEKAVQSVVMSPNLPSCLPHLNLLGRLLHSQPSLCTDVVHSYGNLLEFLLNGLSYPDEKLKTSVVYVLVQVCSKAPANSLSLPLVQNMCRHLSSNLATAKSHDLTINLLGLVRHLLKSDTYTQCLLRADKLNTETKGSTFASAFKRVLLSRDELLQLSSVQCIAEVLTHYADYGRVLLNADIAEFLFEALSSKNELLMNSLFYCLNSLAGIDDFYSKYHVVYGIEPIVGGLSTVLRLRSYNAAQMGLSLLTKILTRQPSGVPLFKSHSSFQALVDLLSSALQVQSITVQTVASLTSLLSAQHVPRGFPMSTILPLLAHLLSLVEPLISPPAALTPEPYMASSVGKGLLSEVLLCMQRTCSLAIENGALYLTEEDREFLLLAFRESLLPATLLALDHLERPGPFVSLLSMAVALFDLTSAEESLELAKKLSHTGLIQLILELKAKFPNTVEGFSDLCSVGNQCLERLCILLEESLFPERLTYIRDILHQALPSLNCNLLDCLQILTQRAASQQLPGRVNQGPSSLQSTQAAVLALFYYAYTHEDILVSQCDLLNALNVFLSLNPSLHLLPPTTLSHLTALYALTSVDGSGSNEITGNVLRVLGPNKTTGLPILARSLQRVANPDALFVPNVTVLRWSLQQWGRTSPIVQAWLLRWFSLAKIHQPYMDRLVVLLQTCHSMLECVMDFISDPSDTFVDLSTPLELVQRLLSNSEEETSLALVVYNCLSVIILKPRVQPLPDNIISVLLTLLSRAQRNDACANKINSDLKLVYHITNVVSRNEVVYNQCSPDSCRTVQCGIEVLTSCLKHQNSSSQIVHIVLSNQTLLQKLPKLLPTDNKAKAHTLLSATAMEFIAVLIQVHHKANTSVKAPSPVLSVSTLTAALLSPLPRVQIAGLSLWRAVFSRGGDASPFTIRETKPTGNGSQANRHIRLLTFLVQNCLVNGNTAVCKAAVQCFLELMNYSSTMDPHKQGLMSSWNFVLLKYVTDMYSSTVVPHHYVSTIHTIIHSLLLTAEGKGQLLSSNPQLESTLHSLSQLMYKSLLCLSQSPQSNHVTKLTQDLSACLAEIGKLDRSFLDEHQWKRITQKL